METEKQGAARQHLERVVAAARKANDEVQRMASDDNFVKAVHGVLDRFVYNAQTFLEENASSPPRAV